MSTRVCGNCLHNIRIPHRTYVEAHCEIDNHEISYPDETSAWCKKWAKGDTPSSEKEVEMDRKMQRFLDYVMGKPAEEEEKC